MFKKMKKWPYNHDHNHTIEKFCGEDCLLDKSHVYICSYRQEDLILQKKTSENILL